MSSTNRGGKRSEADDYPTPYWCTERLMDVTCPQPDAVDLTDVLPGGRWCEPGAGDGNIVMAIKRQDITFDLYELRKPCEKKLKKLAKTDKRIKNITICDWINYRFRRKRYDVLITNPPFHLAEDFLKVGLQRARFTVLLLRLNYVGTDKRWQWLHDNMPKAMVLPNRPSFNDDGKTDSIEYAWMIWDSENPVSENYWRLLAITPRNLRTMLPPPPVPRLAVKVEPDPMQLKMHGK